MNIPECNTGPTECAGFLGWLFGHKWQVSKGGYVYTWNHCMRCGFMR